MSRRRPRGECGWTISLQREVQGMELAPAAPLKLAIATAANDPRPPDMRTQTAAVMAVVAQVVDAAG